MRKLGLDIGNARIGVAVSQDSLAIPHSVIQNDRSALNQIQQLAAEIDPAVIYIGLPLSLSGSHTASTAMAIEFAHRLAELVNCEIRMIDERLTSKSAGLQLRTAGKNSRDQKSIIDASAATVILEFAISSERSGFAGKSLEELDA